MQIKLLAKKEHRSLAQEAVVVIARGLEMEISPRQRRASLLKDWQKKSGVGKPKRWSDPVKWIREDRSILLTVDSKLLKLSQKI